MRKFRQSKLIIIIILIIIFFPISNVKSFKNEPPSITTITGVERGKINTYYNYTFYATDPDNDEIYYLVHWGDGIVFYWMGPYKSGEKITLSYCFQLMPELKYNELIISARAKDIHDECGEWGHLNVIITNYKIMKYNFNIVFFNNIFFNFYLNNYWFL